MLLGGFAVVEAGCPRTTGEIDLLVDPALAASGGYWVNTEFILRSSFRVSDAPSSENTFGGFRVASVASVPEPSTYALVLLGAGALYFWTRRKGSNKS